MQTRFYGVFYRKKYISDACYLPGLWACYQIISVFEIPWSQKPHYEDGDSKKWHAKELTA